MSLVVFWFRRDLRLADNISLQRALADGRQVLPLFIFDHEILGKLASKMDARVDFIHQMLAQINRSLAQFGTSLLVEQGTPFEVWEKLIHRFNIAAVYTNHDYEPYARKRDGEIQQLLNTNGIELHSFKDHVVFEKGEVLKNDGNPYTVFTPYSRKWKEMLLSQPVSVAPEVVRGSWYQSHFSFPSLNEIGFEPSGIDFKDVTSGRLSLERYAEDRDFPALDATTHLGIHLRFGTISIRNVLQVGIEQSATFVNELIWRDFYQMILWHFPYVETSAFKPAYDRLRWLNNEDDFEKWKAGETGFPLVDAGMRQLAATGWMHNRVRMVVASFLTKHLLIDWRWGEAWFAEKLLDFELASNNGGWQWASGSGCDAAPYFRVFNPELQMQRFDKKGDYVLRWVPEFGSTRYPQPMVSHPLARDRAIRMYKNALSAV